MISEKKVLMGIKKGVKLKFPQNKKGLYYN